MKPFPIAIVAAFWTVPAVQGQGLMDIGSTFDDGVRLPFAFSVSSSLGYDSKPGANSSSGGGGHLPSDSEGSGFWRNGFTLNYPLGRANNRFNLDANYSNTWYFKASPGTQGIHHAGGVNLLFQREVSERFSFGDSLHLAYQTQPDFQVGASINRPTGGYFSGSNDLWADYKWSTRFSTKTSYTVSNIDYDEESLSTESNTRHELSEMVRYALTRRTAATFEYRFSVSEFPDNPNAESKSHYLLLGVERPLGRFVSMSVSAGGEWRAYDGPLGSRVSPHVEGAINYRARENTTFRLYYRSGLEDTGSAGVQSNMSMRAGLSMTHQFGAGLSMTLGVNSVNSDYTRGAAGVNNRQEDTLETSLGLNYYHHLWRRFGLNAGYTFSMVDSDDPFSEYKRHYLSLGLSAQF